MTHALITVGQRLGQRLGQLYCHVLYGHEELLHFEHGRISLQCTSCTWQSTGWQIGPEERPKVRYLNLRVVRGNRVRRVA